MASDVTLSTATLDSSPEPSRSASLAAPKTQRDPALDGLRGLAVLMVFIFHYGGGLQSPDPAIRLLGYITQACWIGIVLFFALSGFLITGSIWDSIGQQHRVRNFYARRALRILPLYFLALGAGAWLAYYNGASLSDLKPLLLFVFFLQDLPHLAGTALNNPSPLPLYHLWTLAVEEQFYLIWPLVLYFGHSRRHAARLSVWLFGITEVFLLSVYTLAAFKTARLHHFYDDFLLTHTGALALGSAVSLSMGNRAAPTGRKPGSHRIIRKWALPAFLTGLAIFIYSSIYSESLALAWPTQFWLGLPGISIAAAALIPIVLRTGWPRKIFSFPPLGWLGRISYGFYIFHILLEHYYDQLAANFTHETSGDYYQLIRLLIAFALTCIISWLSFHLIELPILSLKRFFPMNSSLPWGEPIEDTGRSRRKRSHSKKH